MNQFLKFKKCVFTPYIIVNISQEIDSEFPFKQHQALSLFFVLYFSFSMEVQILFSSSHLIIFRFYPLHLTLSFSYLIFFFIHWINLYLQFFSCLFIFIFLVYLLHPTLFFILNFSNSVYPSDHILTTVPTYVFIKWSQIFISPYLSIMQGKHF